MNSLYNTKDTSLKYIEDMYIKFNITKKNLGFILEYTYDI